MQRYIFETLHPEIYHGYGKKPPHFEGWYFKVISADESARYAIIPGVFIGQAGGDHAFIQILNGMTGEATYHQFPFEAFRADEETFNVWIGDNYFSQNRLVLKITDDQLHINGELCFLGGEGWPVTLRSPGVMGWYAWLPFMECYHGILSFDHHISGKLTVNKQTIDFTNGRGYLEKDWGQAFPSAYIWQQTNHFDTVGTCLTASVAMIPSVGRTFRGFLLGFYHQKQLYRMTTYTGAKIERLEITDEHVYWTVVDRSYRIEMISKRVSGGLLKAPIRTEMHKRVNETLNSSIFVRFSTRNGDTLFEGTGRCAGLEVHGDLETLLNSK
ncbi:MAG: tocopherol cyclase family protein [Phototrophicales bacterium]